MRSAYLQLGVPGDASPEEIEAAFRKAERLYTRERLAEEAGALGRLAELKAAYQVLRDAGARAAHDRKLQQAVQPPPQPRTIIVTETRVSPGRNLLLAGLLTAGVLFGAGAWVSHRNGEQRKEVAAREQADREAQAQAEARQREEKEQQVAQRARMAAQAESNERRLVMESQVSAARANAATRAQEANMAQARRVELAESQRQESVRLNDERRAAMESRMRTERDKQRVRELCYQQYHRPDC